MKGLRIVLSLLFLSQYAFAEEENYAELYLCRPLDKQYYADKERGWFFREHCRPPQTDEKKETKEELQTQKEKAKDMPLDWERVQDTQYLETLTAKEFRELLDRVKEEAVYHPDSAKMLAYLRMQDFMKDKTMTFAYTWRDTLLQHPELDMTVRQPTSNFGAQVRNKIVAKEKRAIMEEIRNNTGLIFFVSNECPYCHEQNKIIDFLRSDYGMTVKTISSNECGPGFGDCAIEPLFFEKFQVKSTPTLIAVFRDDKDRPVFQPISVGIITLDDIVNRLVFYYQYQKNGKYPES
jgi:conjugal transfer pilus assembly protein TraF